MIHAARVSFCVLIVGGVLLGCRRTEPQPAVVSAPATVPAPAQGETAVAAPAAVVPESTPADAATGGGSPDADTGGPDASMGSWLEGNIYRLKVEQLRRCRAATGGAGGPADAGAPVLLGVRVLIQTKIDQLFVTARDMTLESDGVIFQAQVLTSPLPNCGPVLVQRQLRVGQSVGGFAVFQLPADFQPDPRGPLLSFQPTRWGGGKRTELRLPACLADCAKAPGGPKSAPTQRPTKDTTKGPAKTSPKGG